MIVLCSPVELTGSAAEMEPPDIGGELCNLKEVIALETCSTRSSGKERQLNVQDREFIEVNLVEGSRWYQVSGIRYQVSGIRYQVSGIWYLTSVQS